MRGALLAVAIALDILLKVLARVAPIAVGRFSFPTRFGILGLAPSVNDVLAFSLPIPNRFIWPVGWVVVAWLIRELRHAAPRTTRRFAITAIIIGACANLADRTFFGGVTDYLALTDLFPAFNVADLLILGGVVGWVRSAREPGRAPSSHEESFH